jgi:hypothetical protein
MIKDHDVELEHRRLEVYMYDKTIPRPLEWHGAEPVAKSKVNSALNPESGDAEPNPCESDTEAPEESGDFETGPDEFHVEVPEDDGATETEPATTKAAAVSLLTVEFMPDNDDSVQALAPLFPVDDAVLKSWLGDNETYLLTLPYAVTDVNDPAGCNFFTHNWHGKYTEVIEKARQWFEVLRLDAGKVCFLVRGSSFQPIVQAWNNSFHKQAIAGGPYHPFLQGAPLLLQRGAAVPADCRPESRIGAKGTFFNSNEMLLQHLYNVTGEHEYLKQKQKDAAALKVKARFVPILHSRGTEYYMFIEAEKTFRLVPDDKFKMVLKWGEGGRREEDWSGRVIKPIGLAPSDLICTTVSRAWIKEDEASGVHSSGYDWTAIPPESVIDALDATAHSTAAAFREALNSLQPCVVKLQLIVSEEQVKRQYNMLNHTQFPWGHEQDMTDADKEQLRAAMDDKTDHLTFKNLRHELEPMDVFAPFRDHPEFDAVLAFEAAGFNEGQRRFMDHLRFGTARVKILQGVPGSGKTKVVRAIVRIFYQLVEGPTRLVLLAPDNQMVNEIAHTTHNTLLELHNSCPDKFHYPVTIREHAPDTEKNLARREALLSRNEKLERPAHLRPVLEEDGNIDTSAIPIAQELYHLDQEERKLAIPGVRDKRVKHIELSRGYNLLKVIGYLKDDQGNKFPCAHPDDAEFASCRAYLEKLASGQELLQEEAEAWPGEYGAATQYLNSRIDVQVSTSATYMAQSVHTAIAHPIAAILDEAGKTSEINAIGAYLLSDISTLIVVGDTNQNKHIVAEDPDALHFVRQASVSFFSRAMIAGVQAIQLEEQFRFPTSIANMMVALGARGLRVHPSVMARPDIQRGQEFVKEVFQIHGSNLVFVDITGAESVKPEYSTSKFNTVNIDTVLFLLVKTVQFGYSPEDIGILAPYTAQTNEYNIALYNMAKYALSEPSVRKATLDALKIIARAIEQKKLDLFTWDSAQGKEKLIVFADTVTADAPGFLNNHGKLYAAGSRSLAVLVWIGCTAGWEESSGNAHAYKRSKLGRLAEYCKGREATAIASAIPDVMFRISKEQLSLYTIGISHSKAKQGISNSKHPTGKLVYAFDYQLAKAVDALNPAEDEPSVEAAEQVEAPAAADQWGDLPAPSTFEDGVADESWGDAAPTVDTSFAEQFDTSTSFTTPAGDSFFSPAAPVKSDAQIAYELQQEFDMPSNYFLTVGSLAYHTKVAYDADIKAAKDAEAAKETEKARAALDRAMSRTDGLGRKLGIKSGKKGKKGKKGHTSYENDWDELNEHDDEDAREAAIEVSGNWNAAPVPAPAPSHHDSSRSQAASVRSVRSQADAFGSGFEAPDPNAELASNAGSVHSDNELGSPHAGPTSEAGSIGTGYNFAAPGAEVASDADGIASRGLYNGSVSSAESLSGPGSQFEGSDAGRESISSSRPVESFAKEEDTNREDGMVIVDV